MSRLKKEDLYEIFNKKRVCIVGSGPSVMENASGHIDSYEVVVRVNNYKTKGIDKKGKEYDFTEKTGSRCDYHYSFYGSSIRKTVEELIDDGVKAHLCKCPNDECHVTEWHKGRGQIGGGDFRPLYRRRESFWGLPVYIPQKKHYMKLFDALGRHVPTTGFMGIWEILQCEPKELYITGFDFMSSGVHNVNERWLKGREDDPVRHIHHKEEAIVRAWYFDKKGITLDRYLARKFSKAPTTRR